MVEEQKLNELWKQLAIQLESSLDSITDVRNTYGLLLNFLSVAWSLKLETVSMLRVTQSQMSGSDYMKSAQQGVLKGMHYEERRIYRRLSLPEKAQQAHIRLETIDDMLEAARQYERILKSLYEAMKLDWDLSFKGHS